MNAELPDYLIHLKQSFAFLSEFPAELAKAVRVLSGNRLAAADLWDTRYSHSSEAARSYDAVIGAFNEQMARSVRRLLSLSHGQYRRSLGEKVVVPAEFPPQALRVVYFDNEFHVADPHRRKGVHALDLTFAIDDHEVLTCLPREEFYQLDTGSFALLLGPIKYSPPHLGVIPSPLPPPDFFPLNEAVELTRVNSATQRERARRFAEDREREEMERRIGKFGQKSNLNDKIADLQQQIEELKKAKS